jgi:hypothetical protein
MNEICKGKIRDRLLDALKKEGLPTNTAGGLLKISPSYLSMVKNPKLWSNVSEEKWELLQKWCNSGLGIGVYGRKIGASENVASEENVQEVAIKKMEEEKERYRTELEKVLPMMIPVEEIPITEETIIHDIQAQEKTWSEKKFTDASHKAMSAKLDEALIKSVDDVDWKQKAREYSELLAKDNLQSMEVKINTPANQKIVLDIEINILLNGVRIKIG